MIKEQRGAVIILFALIIPFIMCCTGLAIDLGNMYVHYSRLQNAADAAALAGANAYAESGGETETANNFAQRYVTVNEKNASFKSPPQIKDKDGKIYYVVVLKERVPLYFLRYFPQIGSDTEISAAGCAQITLQRQSSGKNSGGGTDLFNNLFVASAFDSVNPYQNRDKYGEQSIEQIKSNSSTYEGSIVITDRGNFSNAYGKTFLSPEAFGSDGTKQSTVNDAISHGYVNIPEYNGTLDVTEYYRKTVKDLMTADSTYKVTDPNNQNVILNIFYSDTVLKGQSSADVIYFNIPNLNLTISNAISGDPNKPLYVICDNINMLHFSGDMTSGRPIVLINRGSGELALECSGGKFTGDIYAPYGSVKVNDNGLTFYGSIVAKNRIQLQSNGYYFQKNYVGDGSTGNKGYKITLVNAKEVLES
ncbi:TadE/TadG family type IV pilus assembly protein [Anaerovibrio sp. RM50]|uniref:TadE/TadG family type IV pilus assembly protein n=1 Tax=Anaerovibrio sp. RM50 TaxID=1200557 RepID=UPI0004811E97|nr:pilus assembly protein TadG-related protein [Anaerovibrio sp. RM50]